MDHEEAEGIVRRLRRLLPDTVSSDYVYIKLFKNMPRSDVEMIFPNTKVKFRLFDKIKFGVTAGSGFGVGVVGTASKIAIASNPYTLVMALAGLGGVALRQASTFINQRNRYMVVMARNLYFHSMADNRGVMTLLADRAAEEDIKEEMLLYSVLAKERVQHSRPQGDRRGDRAVSVPDLRHRSELRRGGCAPAAEAGGHRHRAATTARCRPLQPREAALHIDKLWDACLDQLPDIHADEGREIEGAGGALMRPTAACAQGRGRPMTLPMFQTYEIARGRARTRPSALRGCAS